MHYSFSGNLLQKENIAATIARMEVASSRRRASPAGRYSGQPDGSSKKA